MSIVGEKFDSSECGGCELREVCAAGQLLEEVVVEPLVDEGDTLRGDGGPLQEAMFSASIGAISPTELRGRFAEVIDAYANQVDARTELFESMVQEAVGALYDLDGNVQSDSPDVMEDLERVVADNQTLKFESSVTPESLFLAAVDVNRYGLSGQCGALEINPTVPGPLVNR